MLILDLIFPPKCIFCSKLLSAGTQLCICGSCEVKIPAALTDSDQWTNCCFDKLSAASEYSGIIREALLRFKFASRPGYGRTFARLITDTASLVMRKNEFDMVVSVPLYKDRKNTRGYNQSLVISKEIARITGIAEMSPLLVKIRGTQVQSKLGKEARKQNVLNVFGVRKSELVKGKRILLIDDIITTGSTLNECARVLKQAGAIYVEAAVVAEAEISRQF